MFYVLRVFLDACFVSLSLSLSRGRAFSSGRFQTWYSVKGVDSYLLLFTLHLLSFDSGLVLS